MAQDQQTFIRARNAAIAGLAIQSVMIVATALLGLWTSSPAIQSATWHMVGGLPIWVILALIFNQHKIERLEAMEAEQLARDDQQAAMIFEEHADDLDLSRRRLDRLYQWGLPIVSALVAVFLLGMGGWKLWQALRAPEIVAATSYEFQAIDPEISITRLLAVSLGLAFVAFVVARWISGYTRVRDWQLLRGGASYLMSTGLLLALVAAAAGVAWFTRSGRQHIDPFYILALAVPIVMLLIGTEILLTFLLSAYRPRRPGEVPRPAFDSRVLGLLTSPESLGQIVSETINYQFGFEISRSWFYRLLSRALTPLMLFALLCLFLMSTVVIVAPHEEAVILQFGRMIRDDQGLPRVLASGVQFKLPWPIQTVERYPIGRVQQIEITTQIDPRNREAEKQKAQILWTTESEETAQQEEYLLTAPGQSAMGEVGEGQGMALLASDVTVQYSVADLEQYLASAANPAEMLRVLAEREVASYFASHDIDWLLTHGLIRSTQELQERLQASVARAGLGLEVVHVGLTGVHPPLGKVSNTFHDQIGALQERESALQEAQRDAIKTLAEVAGSVEFAERISDAIEDYNALKLRLAEAADPAAREQLAQEVKAQEVQISQLLAQAHGEAAKLIHAATAYRWKQAIGGRTSSARSVAEFEAFQVAPNYYRARRYYDTLAGALKDRRKYILVSEQTAPPAIHLNLEDEASPIDTIFGEAR